MFNYPVLFRPLAAAFALSLLLTGCDSGSSPDKSWEVAVKGTYSAALSADSQLAIIGSITHGGSLWQAKRGERLFNWNHQQGDPSNIIACTFSPEGRFAFTADHQTMVLWSTDSGRALTYWTAPSEVTSVALTPEGRYALLGLADYSVVLFDVQHGGIKRSFYHSERVRSVAVSADGKLAISGSDDQSAKLWDLESGKQLQNWPHQEAVITVALSPDGSRAFTVAKYDRAVVWDTHSGKALGQLPLGGSAIKRGQAFTSASFSADSKRLLTGNSDRLVQLWDAGSLKELGRWQVPKRDLLKPTGASIAAVGFSASSPNEFYAVASNGFIHRLKR